MLWHGAGGGRTQTRSLVGKRQGKEPGRRKVACYLTNSPESRRSTACREPRQGKFCNRHTRPRPTPQTGQMTGGARWVHGLQRSGCSAVLWPRGSVWLSHVAWRQNRADGLAKRCPPGLGGLPSTVQFTLQSARPQHWGVSRGSQGSSPLCASTACQPNQQTSV